MKNVVDSSLDSVETHICKQKDYVWEAPCHYAWTVNLFLLRVFYFISLKLAYRAVSFLIAFFGHSSLLPHLPHFLPVFLLPSYITHPPANLPLTLPPSTHSAFMPQSFYNPPPSSKNCVSPHIFFFSL